jgi:cation diffusion facilitator CzcD-associated flavoprotein CzcO
MRTYDPARDTAPETAVFRELRSMTTNRTDAYLVIGAGSSGLAIAKNLLQQGVDFDILERETELGGNWWFEAKHSSIYQSTHLVSSKLLTEYTDFPMPASFPDYPHHSQVFQYLKSYAHRFEIYTRIQFGCGVREVAALDEQTSSPTWRVTLNSGEVRDYGGIVIANGHNWKPKIPRYPGEFSGTIVHSAQYKSSDTIRNRRVLVIGAGNSGCDIAVEAAQQATATFHSTRRGYHYIPKYVFGRPADQVGEVSLRLGLPLWARRAVIGFLLKLVQGSPETYGLPRPDHQLFETHPIINSLLLYYLGQGDIIPKPDVRSFKQRRVQFTDGTEVEVDVVVYATGFEISFPFLDNKYLNWGGSHPELYLNIFHPEYDNLFVIGLIQPDSGQFGLVDYQGQLVARFVRAQHTSPEKGEALRKLKRGPRQPLSHGIKYLDSTRHYLEVEHFSYRKRLKALIDTL